MEKIIFDLGLALKLFDLQHFCSQSRLGKQNLIFYLAPIWSFLNLYQPYKPTRFLGPQSNLPSGTPFLHYSLYREVF